LDLTASFRIAKCVPGSTVEPLRGPGHLMHEEDPQAAADMIVKAVADVKAGVR
jgi:pimeloyl-ACP methyl ester carboxylesterase